MDPLRFLRALLATLLQMLGWRPQPKLRTTRPLLGPAGPWMRHHHAALRHTAPRQPHHHLQHPHHVRIRPARVPPPPHILAILAAAPDIEPDLAPRRPTPHPTLLEPPAEAPPAPAAPSGRSAPRERAWLPSLALRLSRACSAVADWLVVDAPPDRGRRPC